MGEVMVEGTYILNLEDDERVKKNKTQVMFDGDLEYE